MAPESTKVLRKKKKKRNKRKDGGMSSGHRSQPKESRNGNARTIWAITITQQQQQQQKPIVLDYNSKNK